MKRKGKVFFKIISMENLYEAHRMARKDKSHYREVQLVDSNPEFYLNQIREMLLNDDYNLTIKDYRISRIIDKGKEREIMKVAYFPHRIIQWAIMLQIQDRFLKSLITDTYASIKNRGLHIGARKLKNDLYKYPNETTYCLKVDMKKYYPNMNNYILYEQVKRLIKDKYLLRLFKTIIFSVGPLGQPIGSLLSQWFGNIYLSPLDRYVKEELKLKYYYRYCDDIVILSDSKEKLFEIRNKINDFIQEKLCLTLKENHQIFPTRNKGIDFLGYRFFGNFILLRKTTLKRMKKKLIKLQEKDILTYREHSTISSYKGWLKCCDSYRLYQKYFLPFKDKKYITYNVELRSVNICM